MTAPVNTTGLADMRAGRMLSEDEVRQIGDQPLLKGLVCLAAEWIQAAGLHEQWMTDPAECSRLVAEALTWEKADKRALLRCAWQLLDACAAARQTSAAQMLADQARDLGVSLAPAAHPAASSPQTEAQLLADLVTTLQRLAALPVDADAIAAAAYLQVFGLAGVSRLASSLRSA